MITINLEKSLIRNKQKTLSKEEIFILNKMDALSKNSQMNSLKHKLGVWEYNSTVADNATKKSNTLAKFRPDRVFHKNDIKTLCCKYGLRFLPINYFNGDLDEKLPSKIEEFEKQYDKNINRQNSYIAAPASSFRLEDRPKDPLFFFKIDDEYFYLVHKWGNDISALRLLTNWFFRSVAHGFFGAGIVSSLIGYITFLLHPISKDVFCASFMSLVLICVIGGMVTDDIINSENWDSSYN